MCYVYGTFVCEWFLYQLERFWNEKLLFRCTAQVLSESLLLCCVTEQTAVTHIHRPCCSAHRMSSPARRGCTAAWHSPSNQCIEADLSVSITSMRGCNMWRSTYFHMASGWPHPSFTFTQAASVDWMGTRCIALSTSSLPSHESCVSDEEVT